MFFFRKKSQHPFLQNAQEIVKNYGAFCIKLLYLQTKHFPKAVLLKKNSFFAFCACDFLIAVSFYFYFPLPVSFFKSDKLIVDRICTVALFARS